MKQILGINYFYFLFTSGTLAYSRLKNSEYKQENVWVVPKDSFYALNKVNWMLVIRRLPDSANNKLDKIHWAVMGYKLEHFEIFKTNKKAQKHTTNLLSIKLTKQVLFCLK